MKKTIKPDKPLKIITPEVTSVYFAEIQHQGNKVNFNEVKEGVLDEELYIIVNTVHIRQGHKIKIELFQAESDSKTLLTNAQKQDIIVEVGNFKSRGANQNQAVARVVLGVSDNNNDQDFFKLVQKENLYVSLRIDAEIDDTIDYEVSYNMSKFKGNYEKEPNLWYNGEKEVFKVGTDKNTIHIYHTGEISKLDFEGLKEVTYIYHSNDGKKHDLGNFEIIEVDKLKKGKTLSSNKFREDEIKKEDRQTAVKIITYNKEGVDAKETRIYSDGDIITKGNFRVKFRIYEKSNGKVNLVKMKALDYLKEDTKIKFIFHETLRIYSNPELFAGFIGAVAKCSLDEIRCTGSSYQDSSCYPSTTHVNGQSIDTCYLNRKSDEQKFINALWDFGFKLHYVGSNMNYTHGVQDKYHNDHLHSGNFTPNYKK